MPAELRKAEPRKAAKLQKAAASQQQKKLKKKAGSKATAALKLLKTRPLCC